ncbi:MAG TPA: response regulator, partial [Planctomycetota bacterium]|nr:response regulator [Planctomycetota bacterium]
MSRMFEEHVVVCVDDEPAILAALRRALRREPYEILTTELPERALHWVHTRDVSLVITDQRMPGMQGTELLEEVCRSSPSTARIILTAYPGSTAAVPGLRHRAECMISKPWDGGMLRRVI